MTTMMYDRSMMMGSMGAGAMNMNPMSMNPMMMGAMPGTMPATPSFAMVPRCEMKFEKCEGGMKIHCMCKDEVMRATLQNMCKMLCDGMCSCCCMMNGMMMCQCNMCMCACKCENTKDGVCITCTSGDKACCDMMQACCDCMASCMAAGCMCCVCFGGTPVCCSMSM